MIVYATPPQAIAQRLHQARMRRGTGRHAVKMHAAHADGAAAARRAQLRARFAAARSGGQVDGLDFSWKAPKWLRAVGHSIAVNAKQLKKDTTLKNVAKVAAIGAGVVVGAPIVAAAAKAAVPFAARGALSLVRGGAGLVRSGANLVRNEVSSVAHALMPGGSSSSADASSGNDSDKSADPGKAYGPQWSGSAPGTSAADLLAQQVQSKIAQQVANGTAPASAGTPQPGDASYTPPASSATYGPVYTGPAPSSPSYPDYSQADSPEGTAPDATAPNASQVDAASMAPEAKSLPSWAVPVGIAGLALLVMSSQRPARQADRPAPRRKRVA